MQLNFFTPKNPIINLSLYLADLKSANVNNFYSEVKGRYSNKMTAELKAVNPDKDLNAKAVAVDFDNSFACKVAHLFNQKQSSDKVYHLYLFRGTKDSHKVVSRYGRRDKSLKTAQKYFERLENAEKDWQSIYSSKLRKGYEIGKPIVQESLGLEVWG